MGSDAPHNEQSQIGTTRDNCREKEAADDHSKYQKMEKAKRNTRHARYAFQYIYCMIAAAKVKMTRRATSRTQQKYIF